MPNNQHIESNSLINEDLAPVPENKRTWGTWNYVALWIGMSLCIPAYMLASGLIKEGMNWWQAILTIFLANSIVLVPMILNGRAGTKYGIPFPVLARASFGTRGANIPAMLRAIIACGWFGIQTWIGGAAIYAFLRIWNKDLAPIDNQSLLPQALPMICFLGFWLLNMFIIYLGVDSIKKLLLFKAFFLPAAALALLAWALDAAGGFGNIMNQSVGHETGTSFGKIFFPALTGMVGFWATLSLNISDFTRYAKDQRSQTRGQTLGLAPSMGLIAFIGVIVTSATTIVYQEPIWNPIDLAGKFGNHLAVSFALISIVLSTLATNVAANIVSPANDFSNLAPSKISFRTGGYITGIVGILIFPWKLIAIPGDYIFVWLGGYSALLGPIAAIMIVDYFLIRKEVLNAVDLYRHNGQYYYKGGFNRIAIIALLAGVAPNIPGFFVQIKLIGADEFPHWIAELYNYAWFIGFFISAVVYWLLMKRKKN